MKNIMLGTLSFALFAMTPSLLLSLSALLSGPTPRQNPSDDFLFVAYYLAVSHGLMAAGFLVSTALSQTWRRTRTLHATVIASLLGLVSPAAYYAVLALTTTLVLPLFRTAAWSAVAITHVMPGLVLGAAAHLLFKFVGRPRPQPI
jgi:hypothetical protein